MSKIENVLIEQVDNNPHRHLDKYPYVLKKIDALKRSIEDVGLWEGIIGRRVGNRVQIAFGHHRLEAARQCGLNAIPLIVRDLSDEEMLRFMGRENMEDYNADFLTMLETWEAALDWLTSRDVTNMQPIEITRLLGWTQARTGGGDQMNRTADACNAASNLIRDGYLKREDLEGLNTHEAREICTRAQSNMSRLDALGKIGGRPATEIRKAKEQVAKGAKETIRQSRAGHVAQKDLRGQVDLNTYRHAKTSKVETPLFEQFGKQLADNVRKMLAADVTADKLKEVAKAVTEGAIHTSVDKQIVARIDFELEQLGERTTNWRKRMVSPSKKVTQLHIAKGDEA